MMQEENQNQVVIDKATTKFSDLWEKEDYWAIWIGFTLLIIGIIIFLPHGPAGMYKTIDRANSILKTESQKAPFKTIAWFNAIDLKEGLKASNSDLGKKIKKFISKPGKWTKNPLNAFYKSNADIKMERDKALNSFKNAEEILKNALAAAKSAELSAENAEFKGIKLNQNAVKAIDEWRRAKVKAAKAKKKTKIKSFNKIPYLAGFLIVLAILFGIGLKSMDKPILKFFAGFALVFFIAVLAYTAANNSVMRHYGIGYPVWAIIFGLIISNTIGTPEWIKPAVQTEYYIKAGLVLLGAEILFGKILSIGIPGIFVAWVVTPIVLVSTYLLGQKIIKIPSKTLNMTISADMSVCGVSAAIAAAAACRAKKEELTLAVGLSLVFTSIMMIVMPAIIKAVGIPYILGGAWMGGTIDATGAVAAAGAFLSERALWVAATVKMIQNVLIGVIAFFIALYWCAKIDCAPGQKVRAVEIWHRFPKFVLGFIFASIVFSLIYQYLGNDIGYAVIDHGVIRGMSKTFRGWFFCLAFVSIGLATNFKELKVYFKGGKPLILYVCGQSFNLMLTLFMAYIMFYLVFPEITAGI